MRQLWKQTEFGDSVNVFRPSVVLRSVTAAIGHGHPQNGLGHNHAFLEIWRRRPHSTSSVEAF
jgi:hypothetical protein